MLPIPRAREHDEKGIPPAKPRLRLSERHKHNSLSGTEPDSMGSTKMKRLASGGKSHSGLSSPEFSVTVDLPTLRPGSGIYKHSPKALMQPIIDSLTDEEEGNESDNDDDDDDDDGNNIGESGIDETLEEVENGDGYYEDPMNSKLYDTEGEIVRTPSSRQTEFFFKETTDLLNHRNKLLGDLHFTSDPSQSDKTSSASPSSSMSSNIEPPKLSVMSSDISIMTNGDISQKHSLSASKMRKDANKQKNNFLVEKFPDLPPKQHLKIQNRAKHVTSYIDTYYRYIEEYQKVHEYNADGTIKYPGIDGVWNPIQIMRNRRIRMKHGEKLSKVETYDEWKKVRIACKSFSKNDRSRLIWHVGLNEIIGDIKWREYGERWIDLRDSDGKRWFPKHKHEKVKVAVKDAVKDFKNKESKDMEKQSSSSSNELRADNGTATIPQVIVSQVDRDLMDDKDVEYGSRRPNGASSSISSSAGENLATAARFEHYKRKGMVHNGSNPTVPTLKKYNEADGESGNNRAELEPADNDSNGAGNPENRTSEYNQANYYDAVEELIELVSDYKGVTGDIETSRFELEMKQQLMSREIERRRDIMKNKMNEIEELQRQNRDKYMDFVQLIERADSEVESQRKVIQTRAVRIEELLGYCDRTNGEIITSITLKIRNLNEMADGMFEQCDGSKWPKLMYKLVEGSIVAILWIVWVVVETWIWSKWGVTGVFKCIGWVLGY